MRSARFRPRNLMPGGASSADAATHGRLTRGRPMADIFWLALLGGLSLLTFAFVRLCDEA